jgi:malonyl-CoA O-methyltransferase
MLKPPDLDPKAVRRQFSRRAARIGDRDFLLREVEQRMVDRLDVIRLTPKALIDVGCGRGRGLALLGQRFPKAMSVGVDAALPMLAGGSATGPGAIFLQRIRRALLAMRGSPPPAALLAADASALPFASGSFDMIWSNLAWHWFDDPTAVAAEWYRLVRPEGLLMFTSFGVDTLQELRSLGASLPEFPDMHDIGDLLGQTGYAEPVLETERLTVSYDDPTRLLAELGALGGNALRSRKKGLTGRSGRNRWLDEIERVRGGDGRLALTFEVIFAHAWCPAKKRLADGFQTIHWQGKSEHK